MRLLLFADAELASSVKLLRGTLEVACGHPEVEVCGIVDVAAAPGPSRRPTLQALGTRAARLAFNPRSAAQIADRPRPGASDALAQRHRIPLLRPGAATVNDRELLDAIGSTLRPDAALVLMVGQVFEPPLLAACGTAVNYHDGLLPSYRGVGATAWSVYNEEPRSGFVFNRLVQGLDEGPVLLQDSVAIPPQATTAAVERAKTAQAVARIGDSLELLATGAPGSTQAGEPRLYRRSDLAAMRRVGDPSSLTWAELQRRLRAFEELELELGEGRWKVTRVRRRRGHRNGRFGFVTADGVAAEPTRFKHLPPAVYRAARSLARRA